MEYVDLIDEQDQVMGRLSRPDMRQQNALHRVSATFVVHPNGRLFIQKRSPSKDVFPSLYDVVVGGTVTTGETYAQNARRELAEELGISAAPLYPLFSHRYQDHHTNSIIQVFATTYAGPMTLQLDEVDEGHWASPEEVDAFIGAGWVCPDSAQGWKLYQAEVAKHGPLEQRVREGKLTAMEG